MASSTTMSRDFAAYLQSTGPEVRRPRRRHDAERAAISGRHRRHPARRHDGGERQSALHAARARAPAQRFRRRGDRHPGEFRHHAGEGDQEHARQARHPRQHGRHARLPERCDRQSGRAQGEEDGAGLFAAAAPCSSRRRSRPARASRSTRARSRRTTWRSCNTPAAPPACRRARRCSIATSWRTCCRTMPGCSLHCRRSRRSISC